MKREKGLWGAVFLVLLHFCGQSGAQMPVEREAHHKIIYENGYFRLLDLFLRPGDTTLPHLHAAQSIVIWMTNSNIGIENTGGPVVRSHVSAGDAVFRPYGDHPVEHIVWNEDTGLFHCMVVESRRKEAGMGVHKLTPGMADTMRLPSARSAYLLVAVSGGISYYSSGSRQSLRAGEFSFFPAGTEASISGANEYKSSCVLVEFSPG